MPKVTVSALPRGANYCGRSVTPSPTPLVLYYPDERARPLRYQQRVVGVGGETLIQ